MYDKGTQTDTASPPYLPPALSISRRAQHHSCRASRFLHLLLASFVRVLPPSLISPLLASLSVFFLLSSLLSFRYLFFLLNVLCLCSFLALVLNVIFLPRWLTVTVLPHCLIIIVLSPSSYPLTSLLHPQFPGYLPLPDFLASLSLLLTPPCVVLK